MSLKGEMDSPLSGNYRIDFLLRGSSEIVKPLLGTREGNVNHKVSQPTLGLYG